MNHGIKNSVVAGVGSYVPEMVLDNQKLSQKLRLQMNGFEHGPESQKEELPRMNKPPVISLFLLPKEPLSRQRLILGK